MYNMSSGWHTHCDTHAGMVIHTKVAYGDACIIGPPVSHPPKEHDSTNAAILVWSCVKL